MAGMYQFYVDVYEVVDDPSLDSIISWSKSNKSFVIWNPEELIEKKIVSRFFCSTLSHFITELNTHGFVRIMGSEHLEFGHDQYFVRGEPELLKKMHDQAAMDKMKKRAKSATSRVEENRLVSDIRYQKMFGSRIAKPVVEKKCFVRGEPEIWNATDLRIRYQKMFGSRIAKPVVEKNRLQDNKECFVRRKPEIWNATDLRIRYQKTFGSRIANKPIVEKNRLQDNKECFVRGKPEIWNATDLRIRYQKVFGPEKNLLQDNKECFVRGKKINAKAGFKKIMESTKAKTEVENGLQHLQI